MSNIKWEAFGDEAIGRVGGKIKYICRRRYSSHDGGMRVIYIGVKLGDNLEHNDITKHDFSIGVIMAQVENHHDNQVNEEKEGEKFTKPIRSNGDDGDVIN